MTSEPGSASPSTPGGPAGREDGLFSPAMQRLGAASGLAFVVIVLVQVLATSADMPDYTAPASEFVSYADENAGKLQWGAVLICLAGIALLWFVGYLRSALARAETAARGFSRLAEISFAGGIVAVAALLTTVIVGAASANLPEGTEPSVVRAMSILGLWTFLPAAAGFAVWLGAAGILSLRARVLPVWLGWLAMLSALAYTVTLFVALNPEDDEGVAGVGFPVGFFTLLLFVLATSIVLIRRIGRPASAS